MYVYMHMLFAHMDIICTFLCDLKFIVTFESIVGKDDQVNVGTDVANSVDEYVCIHKYVHLHVHTCVHKLIFVYFCSRCWGSE